MAFTLRIDTDNAAFQADTGDAYPAFSPGPELARTMRKLADRLDDGTDHTDGLLYDINGNRVGSWEITEREGY